MNLVPKDIPSFSSQKNRKLYSAIKPPSFSHLMPLFFLNHANEFLILTEESGNRPVSSITLASPTLRSSIVLYIAIYVVCHGNCMTTSGVAIISVMY